MGDTIAVNVDSEGVAAVLKVCKSAPQRRQLAEAKPKPKGTAAPATPNGKTYCCGVGSGPDCGGPDWTPLNFTFSAKGATADVAITIDSAASACAAEPCVVNGTDVTFTNLANKTDCLGNVVRGTGALTTDLVVKYDPVGDTIAVNVDSEGVAAVLKVCK